MGRRRHRPTFRPRELHARVAVVLQDPLRWPMTRGEQRPDRAARTAGPGAGAARRRRRPRCERRLGGRRAARRLGHGAVAAVPGRARPVRRAVAAAVGGPRALPRRARRVADEPTAALDARAEHAVFATLHGLAVPGRTPAARPDHGARHAPAGQRPHRRPDPRAGARPADRARPARAADGHAAAPTTSCSRLQARAYGEEGDTGYGPGMTDRAGAPRGVAGVATLTLDSPANRNALSAQLRARAARGVHAALADDAVRVVVLTTPGGCSAPGWTSPRPRGAAPQDQGVREFPDHPRRDLELTEAGGRRRRAVRHGPAGWDCWPPATWWSRRSRRRSRSPRCGIGLVPAVISAVVLPRMLPHVAHELLLTGETFDAESAAADRPGRHWRCPTPTWTPRCPAPAESTSPRRTHGAWPRPRSSCARRTSLGEQFAEHAGALGPVLRGRRGPGGHAGVRGEAPAWVGVVAQSPGVHCGSRPDAASARTNAGASAGTSTSGANSHPPDPSGRSRARLPAPSRRAARAPRSAGRWPPRRPRRGRRTRPSSSTRPPRPASRRPRTWSSPPTLAGPPTRAPWPPPAGRPAHPTAARVRRRGRAPCRCRSTPGPTPRARRHAGRAATRTRGGSRPARRCSRCTGTGRRSGRGRRRGWRRQRSRCSSSCDLRNPCLEPGVRTSAGIARTRQPGSAHTYAPRAAVR